LDFDYDSFQSVTLQGATNGQFSPEFLVLGISPDISVIHQFTILGGPHPERFVIRPRDAAGNLTINGNLGIGGGGGLDTLVVNDADSSLPINYSFFNRFGVGRTEIGGLGAGGFGVASDVESFVVNAGTASDTFQVDHLSSGALAITGSNGDDVLEITPTTKNIAANIGATTNINFDGGDGSDSMRLHNDNASVGVTYVINGTLLRAFHEFGGPAFNASFVHSLVEQTAITGGPQTDFFVAEATVAGANYDFDGGPGAVVDGYYVGSQPSPRTDLIRGGVRVTGAGGGNDVIGLYNTSDLIGRTFHIDTDSVGAIPGDNLFGPGGYLNFVDVTGTMTFFLGSGPDTVYAMPNGDTPITINANNPTTAPGDKLTLALAQAQSPVVTGTTNGNVTSANLQTLNWTGIETLAAPDSVAPTANIVDVTPDPRTTNVASIAIDFSEAVTGFSLADLTLTRNGGANLLPASATLTSGDQIHWTLGNLGALTNTSGTYLLTLTAVGSGIADGAGNPLTISATDTWVANIPPVVGDGNNDGVVNIFDVNIVSSNWGTAGPAGDVNHDGTVNIFDINLISANWTPPGGGAEGGEGSVADDGASASASSSLRVANATAEPTTDSHSASRISISAAASSRLPSLGNLNAMLANWGAGGTTTDSDDAVSRAAVDLLLRSNAGRQNTTFASTIATEPPGLPRPLAAATLHSIRAARHVTAVDAVFQQSRLADWDNDPLDDLGIAQK